MKGIYTLIISVILCLADANAQVIESYRSGYDSLYWVVETNLRDRSYAIVRIYNGQNTKVYEVRLRGEYIDIRKPRHRKKLDMMVRQIHERTASTKKEIEKSF